MKKICVFALSAMLLTTTFVGCKKNKNNADKDKLKAFVENLNSHPGVDLPNGTVLDRCDYAPGDSLLVYHIKVNDKRFEEVEADSIKTMLRKEWSVPDMHVLVSMLKRNNIGVQYVYTTDNNEIRVTLGPAELGANAK